MTTFNHNIRFLLKKYDLSQQKLANRLGEKRGRIAAYVEGSNAPDDFKQKLCDEFNLDLARFLTVVMDDYNYKSFLTSNIEVNNFNESSLKFTGRGDLIQNLMSLKDESDPVVRNKLIDECVKIAGRMMEKENKLKDEINQLQKDLLSMARKS